VVGAIRREWPEVLILLRGDGHFSTPEVHEWCECQEPVIFYILGQSGNAVLKREASGVVDQARSLYRYRQARVYRKQVQADHEQQKSQSKKGGGTSRHRDQIQSKVLLKSKLYTTFLYQAASWPKPRRIICKAEVSHEGENVRFLVTNLQTPRNAWIYEKIYCGRGQMENYIKDHKRFLHSDRTSCHRFEANQFRVFLHSAAYILMHTLRTRGLRGTDWAKAQFDQIQIRILKVGARVEELKTKVRFHFPSSFPLKVLYETVRTKLSTTEVGRSP
jgi:hypothetical protein